MFVILYPCTFTASADVHYAYYYMTRFRILPWERRPKSKVAVAIGNRNITTQAQNRLRLTFDISWTEHFDPWLVHIQKSVVETPAKLLARSEISPISAL